MKLSVVVLFLLFSNILFCQENYPKDYFRSPVDFPIYLSGTFGEPRSTHFHSGMDIKTQGVINKKIYACADGYVSRIKVSPYGYGKALYITHPNGFVTVYAHLESFNTDIQQFTKEQQYLEKTWEIDIDSIPDSILIVRKGEVIALSGNTGSSGGPHLHFEVRDSFERIINPLLFGFDELVKDEIKPQIFNLKIYNRNEFERPFSNSVTIPVSGSKGNYILTKTISSNSREIGFGVHTYDKQTGTSNRNGVYEIKLFFDDSLVYHYKMSRFAFTESRYVHCHLDYQERKNNQKTIHKCFTEPGNFLSAYQKKVDNGELYLSDSLTHKVRIEVYDYHQNKSVLHCLVKYSESVDLFEAEQQPFTELLYWDKINRFESGDVVLYFPKKTLFNDVYFNYETKHNDKNGYQYAIHHEDEPVFSRYEIRLKYTDQDSSLLEKYLIAHRYKQTKISALKTSFVDTGYFKTRARSFGQFYLTLDTIAPVITPVNISEGKTMTYKKSIQFKAVDNLSGIEEWNGFINGNWVPVSYEYKRNLFTYSFDEDSPKGDNEFILIIADERNNSSQYLVNYTY